MYSLQQKECLTTLDEESSFFFTVNLFYSRPFQVVAYLDRLSIDAELELAASSCIGNLANVEDAQEGLDVDDAAVVTRQRH